MTPLTQLIGQRGTGKTFFIIRLLANIKKFYDSLPVYANFNIKCKNFHKLSLITLLDLPPNIFLAMDEAYSMIHSRLSMSYVNIFAGYIAFQLRKTSTQIFVTMQQLRTIDVIYREEWDYRVYCDRLPNQYTNWKLWDFLYEIHDRRRQSITKRVVFFEESLPYFSLYNTNEIIEPRNKSRIRYELLSSEPELLSKESLRIAGIIKPKIKKLTKDETEWALKRSGFDKIWAKDVFIELKHTIKS